MFDYATIPAESDAGHAATLTICRGLFQDDFPKPLSKATLAARRRRWAKQCDLDAAIGKALEDWNDGVRLEEFQAITGLAEATLRKGLARQAKLGWVVDLGDRGWYRYSEAVNAGLVKEA